ncbi:hypothetical protein D3C85_643860 [compost metagenome]
MQLPRMAGCTATLEVGRAGAGNPHHAGQRGGDHACVCHLPGAQYQIDLAQVRAVHVDEAVDQVQLHVQPGVQPQEIGDHRCQVPSSEGSGRVDPDQAFRRAAHGCGLGAGQAQFADDPPCPLGKRQPGGRGTHGVGTAYEQLAAEGVLQAVYAPGHG